MGKKKQEGTLEKIANSDVGQGTGYLLGGVFSLFGNAIHALGSLVHGTGRGVRGVGHWSGKGVEHVGHATGKVAYGGGKLANYLANKVAHVGGRERMESGEPGYVVIKPQEYRRLIREEPRTAKILERHLYQHGNEIRLPLDEMQDIRSELEGYHPRRGRYHKIAAAFLLIAAAILADFTITGAAIGTGGFATYAPVFSLLFLLTAIALFYKK